MTLLIPHHGGLPMNIIQVQTITPSIKKGIITVGINAFGKGMTAEEIEQHVLPMDALYIAYEKEIVGFASAKINEHDIYLAGSAVHKECQRKHIYDHFVARRIELVLQMQKSMMTLRTQNPVVDYGVQRCLDGMVRVGAIAGYTFRREHKEGVYGRSLTDTIPMCRKSEINEAYEKLNYQRGDAYFLEFTILH